MLCCAVQRRCSVGDLITISPVIILTPISHCLGSSSTIPSNACHGMTCHLPALVRGRTRVTPTAKQSIVGQAGQGGVGFSRCWLVQGLLKAFLCRGAG